MAKKTKTEIERGTAIHLVTAAGLHVQATVTNVRKGDLVDLEAEVGTGAGSQTITITSSPCDELGKQADSWHLPEEVVAASVPEVK